MKQKDSDILWLSDGILGLTDSMQKTCNDPQAPWPGNGVLPQVDGGMPLK